MEEAIVFDKVDTPLGKLFLAASPRGLVMAAYGAGARQSLVRLAGESAEILSREAAASRTARADVKAALRMLDRADDRIARYFAGDINALDSLALDVRGTEFQKKIWNMLRAIKGGSVSSYGELAKAAGSPRAVRAAGAACRANPIVLAIPCHRAVAQNRALTGFNAGISRKVALLRHEGLSLEESATGRTEQMRVCCAA